MQLSVVHRIRRLVPEQIPVCARVKICLITRSFFFPDRECHCTVRVCPLDRRHQVADPFIRKIGVFSALQHKGAKSKLIPRRAAGEDLLLREPVALGTCIAPADTAVITVIFAVVGELDQPADIDLFSVNRLCRRSSLSPKPLNCLCIFCCKQTVQFLRRQLLLRLQALYDFFLVCHINLHSADAYTLE